MKILAITDGGNWCLDHLTDLVMRHNPQFHWKVLKVHPKDVLRHLPEIERYMREADIVWHQYFRTGCQIAELLPELVASKKHILTHHNQKDEVFKHDQSWVSKFICHTEAMKAKIEKHYPKTPVAIIRHGIDLDEFSYDDNPYPPEGPSFNVGYAGRTKPWKRLANIQKAVNAVEGCSLVGMGKRDDLYANEIDWSLPNILWHENVPDAERKEVYKKMHCFVQYSEDGIEEGTMPALEAMAMGIPLITSPVGTLKDVIKDGENGLIVNNDDDLRYAIVKLKDNPELCEKLRMNAWETIKGFSEDAMAWAYEKLFWKVCKKIDLVSVVIPTFKRNDCLETIIKAIDDQTYPAIEIVIVDDDPDRSAEAHLERWRLAYKTPIKYLATENKGYGLAQARNMGAIASIGQFIMFLDDRYSPDQDAVVNLVRIFTDKKNKAWLFGDKGPGKKEFVENFGMIRRQDFFDLGMFNERVTAYGGMSQEIRARAHKAGFELLYVPSAKATTLVNTRRKAGRRSAIWRMKHQLKRMGL